MLSESYIAAVDLLDNPYEQGFSDGESGKTLFDCPYSEKDNACRVQRSKWLQGLMTYEANNGIQSIID
jgi:ribosome modulation factor